MFKKDKIPFYIFFLLSFILVVIWYMPGKLLTSGEDGFSIFNYKDIVSQLSIWQENGTGFAYPIYQNRLIPALFVSLLNAFRFPLFLSQAILYFILIFTALCSFYLVVKKILNERTDISVIALVASLFYSLNLYVQSQVLGRMLYFGDFAWAYLPLFLYLWVQWIDTKRRKWLAIFLISSIFFSTAFLHPPYIITLWFVLSMWVIFSCYIHRRDPQMIKSLVTHAVFAFFLWVGVNIWWIFPLYKIGSTSFENFGSTNANLSSLMGVSQYFPTLQIMLLRQTFSFGERSLFYNFYSKNLIYIISILILSIATVGLWTSKKLKNWPFLFSLALLGWFVSKGTNFPLGLLFFKWLFNLSTIFQVYRNSYEKFGIVWILSYSIFFGLGVSWIYQKLKPKIREVAVGIVLFLSCGILVWPMWTGDIYKNARVKVPNFYKQANDFLNQDKSSGRILMLPIIPGDGLRYSWGYQGIEPSEFLFDKPAISKVLRTKYADDKYWQLYYSFINGQDYEKILSEMNVKYLILHDDLIPEVSGASSSAQVRKILSKNPEIKFQKSFGELDIYEYTGNKYPGLFIGRGNTTSSLVYKKLSPTHYLVNINQVDEPFNLIFKETYNDLWEVKIDGKTIDSHYLVYDYANGWKIDKNGSYNVEVIFKVWPWE